MSKPEVYIIESLGHDDENRRKEGEIISRTRRLSGKKPIYRYVRTQRELEYFVSDFAKSNYRYLHVSCHGNDNLISLTLNQLNNDEFARIVAPALARKRLFLSACLATTEDLASKIFAKGACLSVAGPASAINFDDAAVFWSAFYHLMFKKAGNGMANRDIVGSMMAFGWAIAEQFHFFKPNKDGTVSSLVLPSTNLLEKRIDGWLTSGM